MKYSNDCCVFVYERHQFTVRANIGNTNQFFMRANAHCKFDSCTCQLYANLSENGRLKIDYVGKIIHKIHARPIRGSRREELQQLTMIGALHLQQINISS